MATSTYSLAFNSKLTEDYVHGDSILASSSATAPLATFVNAQGQSEALLIQEDGELCHLQREPLSSTGWNIYGIGAVVEAIAAASSGNVWITDTSEDIWQSNAGNWNLIGNVNAGLSGISVGRDGTVYAVGQASDQTFHLFTFDPTAAAFQDNGVTSIIGAPVGNSGSLWALANGPQVFMNGPNAWTQAPGSFHLGDVPNHVNVGNDGSVWVLCENGAIYSYDPSSQSWTPLAGVPQGVGSIAAADAQLLYAQTDQQIQAYSNGIWSTVPPPQYGLATEGISVGTDGTLWALSQYGTVWRYNSGIWIRQMMPTGISGPTGGQQVTEVVTGRHSDGNQYAFYVVNGSHSPLGKLALMNGQTPTVTRVPLPGGSTAELFAGGGTLHTLHSDWLGSSRLSTTYHDRSLAYDVAYSPYGEKYVPSGGSTGDLDFTGQFQDTQAGLYDFPAREYSTVGRWIQPDPSGLNAVDPTNPQSWNRYAYVLNNPLSNIDPLGLDCAYDNGDGRFNVQPGDCNSLTDDGYYFDGTVDPSSLQYNVNGGLLGNVDGTTQCSGDCQTNSVNVTGQQGTLWQLLTTTVPYYDPNDVPLSPSGQAAALAANNGTPSWFQRTLNYLKSHPITISVNEILAGQITYQASTGTICGSVGAGASVPPTKAVTVGILNDGSSMGNWQQVISGPSYSFGANLFVGYQGTFSSSGNVGGPTVSGIGLSGSYTIGGCTTVP
jgi:RHS repeat-associated protein